MAIIKSDSMRDPIYVGTHGNLSLAESSVTLSAAAVDDVVEMLDFDVGIDVKKINVITEGLGASVTIDIKIGDTVVAADLAVSAKVESTIFCDVYTEARSTLTVTIKGAAATGTLKLNPEYIAKGY